MTRFYEGSNFMWQDDSLVKMAGKAISGTLEATREVLGNFL